MGGKMSISILFLAAEPVNHNRLRLGEEFQKIKNELLLTDLGRRFKLKLPQLCSKPQSFSRALLTEKPDIVHFCGHGIESGEICLENQAGELHPVKPEIISTLFELVDTVECVVFNACYSKKTARAMADKFKYVIGINQYTNNRAAIAFSIGFYQALGCGLSFEKAYKAGCIQIDLQNISDCSHPTLMGYGVEPAYNLPISLDNFVQGKTIDSIQAMKWPGAAKNEKAISALSTVFEQQTDPEVKYWAAISIGKIGGEQARSLLLKLRSITDGKNGEDDMVRSGIDNGLKQLERRSNI